MITCPMCREVLPEDASSCRKCKTDLTLLTKYISNLRTGLSHAEAMTRAGELGEAVWAYLAVLEVDPDNVAARRQVGKVATAVRQFDETAPGRRWARAVHRQNRFRRWLARWQDSEQAGFLSLALMFLLFLAIALGSYTFGYANGHAAALEGPATTGTEKERPTTGQEMAGPKPKAGP